MGLKSWFVKRWLHKEWVKLRGGDMKMLSGILAGVVKDAAQGKYGEGMKTLYWSLAGKKTVIALGIAALYGVGEVAVGILAQCVPECGSAEAVNQLSNILAYVPEVVGVLIAIGLFDAAVRIEPPKK